jgi:uncharacterized membrane protein (DUF4010 family)
MSRSDVLGLIVAALGGAAVGLERQWSGHAEGPSARFAGIRTFAMLGAIGGLSGWLWTTGVTLLAGVLLAGAIVITAAAYIAASRKDVEGTTEVAALIVLASGVLAGLGLLRIASGIIAVEVLILVEKSRLHSLVRRIDDVELRAGVRFAVMALVILPLLPDGPFGPLGGIRPRQLWILVLFFSGLSFVGHVLHRLLGPGHGYLVSGAVGGLISSTNVTLTFARTSRSEPAFSRALAVGVVAANAVLYPRVIAATAALNASLVLPLTAYLAVPAAVACIAVLAGAMTNLDPQGTTAAAGRNPLKLSAALQMAVLFQIVLMSVHLAHGRFGQTGVVTTGAILGLTDVDALTVSMARGVDIPIDTAAVAIAVGILANTVLKFALALVFGSPKFRAIVGTALLSIIVAAAATIALRGS